MRYNCLVPFIPKVNGLHDFSPMTLFASYLIGRWMGLRKYIQSPWTSRLKMLGLVVVALALIALICSTGLSLVAYNSPVSVSLAAMVFLLFSRVRLPEKLEKCILFISPSMFAVYLLHEYLWFPDLIDCEWMGLGNLLAKACLAQHCPRFVAAFLSAVSLFALSVCLDLVRRGLLLAVRSPLTIVYRWIDERFENLMVAMAKCIIRA